MNIIPFKLRQLGIADPKSLVMTFASYGALKFPLPKSTEPVKRQRHHWASKKERVAYYNQQAKLRRASK